MKATSRITFVTVCKGRLAHLKQSLPVAAAQAPCVVVDYACPEYAGDWVKANIPEVSVVRAGEPETFHLAAARNAGAAAATSDWFCFIDADVVPSARFVEAITPLLQPGLFYRPWPVTPDTWGTVVCAHADFARLGGYDEAFCDWGGEDDDFYLRLWRLGIRQQSFPSHLLHAIEHDDTLRMRFYKSIDREVSRRVNLVYTMLKNDLRALTGGEADLSIRRAIYAEAQRVLSRSMPAGGQAQLEIDLPDAGLLPEWNARRTLRYVIPAPRSLDAPRILTAAGPIVQKETSRPPMPFIVGTGRCGSTLLRLMLDAHPKLAIPDETHFIPPLARLARDGAGIEQLVESLRPDARWATSGVTAEDLLARARARGGAPLPSVLRAFYECYAQRCGKPRYGDKTPPYVNEMPLIRRFFPEARFVHLIRDGRDVALSMRENAWWGPKSFAETAAWWSSTILAARSLGAVDAEYLEVRYEDLIAEPEVTLRRICEFIELEWDATMLRYYERANERLEELTGFLSESGEFISTERVRGLHTLTREPPNASRIGAWRIRLTPDEIRQFELLAGPLLKELGYESTL